MNYPLTDRQRAMLIEMGVPVGPVMALGQAAPETAGAPVAPTLPMRSAVAGSPPVQRVAAANAEPTMASVRPVPPPHASIPARVTAGGPVFAGPVLDAFNWSALMERASGCKDCALGQTRQHSVWGEFLNVRATDTATDPSADLLIITDPPDETAESAGLPLGLASGAAHQLVENMVAAMGRAARGALPLAPRVFVTNLTKCRVPSGETLGDVHVQACRRYIDRAISLLRPRLIVAMGRSAGLALLVEQPSGEANAPLGRLRGQARAYQATPWIATFTPQYLLRNPKEKAKAWEDLCLGLSVLTQTQPA